MIKISPAVKISLGLVMLTLSVLLVADILGFIPDRRDGVLEGRRQFSESLAIHASVVAANNELSLIVDTFTLLKERHADLISASLVRIDGDALAVMGDHQRNWRSSTRGESTTTHVQVPIFQGEAPWGSLQLVFTPIRGISWLPIATSTFIALMALVGVLGFILYWYFIQRVLSELDPQAVIPDRVKAAFDTLSEGVLILNDDQQIVLANKAFSRKIGIASEKLIGEGASSLLWQKMTDLSSTEHHPWVRCVKDKAAQIAMPIRFDANDGKTLTFMVNATPIHGDDSRSRGVLATFDDVTDLERKHLEQKRTLEELHRTRIELQDRARELEALASRDPLTGCNNRRAFADKLEVAIQECAELSQPLCCVMLDIDFFKSVNDNYGHAVGDEVIRYIADLLKSKSRRRDFVGRLGGEEFSIVLPGTTASEAMVIADEIRIAVYNGTAAPSVPDLKVTASFGVAEFDQQTADYSIFLNRADEALYGAKHNGRNQVQLWRADADYVKPGGIGQDGEQASIDELMAPDNIDTSGHVRGLQKKVVELEHQLMLHTKPIEDNLDRDDLTGMPGRNAFLRDLARRLQLFQANDHLAAIISVDIDSFRRVNEALGSAVGDQLLTRVSETIQIAAHTVAAANAGASKYDAPTVARIANDEFALCIGGLSNLESAHEISRSVFEQLPEIIEVEGRDVFVTYSSGVCVFPGDSDRADLLLDHAIAARSSAKRDEGRNSIRFFNIEMIESSNRDLWLETQLHRALKQDELSLRYQPIVDLKSGRIHSMEALLRWHHPVAGFISPEDFIPIAENTGFIRKIGKWVLNEACEQMVRWQNQGVANVSIAVNLSGIQLQQVDLLLIVGEILRQSGLQPASLVLEITESTLLDNSGDAEDMANTLRDLGIRISLDDFGTGYSSLGAIKTLPVDSLKIDRSFIGEGIPSREDQLILQSVISIAHGLDMEVITEGVTSEEQRSLLQRLQCDQMQGFLFSKPLLAEDATVLLHDNQRQTGGRKNAQVA